MLRRINQQQPTAKRNISRRQRRALPRGVHTASMWRPGTVTAASAPLAVATSAATAAAQPAAAAAHAAHAANPFERLARGPAADAAAQAAAAAAAAVTAAATHMASAAAGTGPPGAAAAPASSSCTLYPPEQEHRRYFSSSALMDDYARRPQTPLSLRAMLDLGNSVKRRPNLVVSSAQFLHEEMLVRLARRAKELRSLPYGLSESKHVRTVRRWYEQSWMDLISVGVPTTVEEDAAFCELVDRILDRHRDVVPVIARAVIDLRGEMGETAVDECPYLHDFLDRFYTSRIGVRLLLHNHSELRHCREGFAGAVCEELQPADVIRDAVTDATLKCEEAYGTAPEVEVRCAPGDLGVPMVPSHLHHIMHELLKNSMRAVVERHGGENPALGLSDDLPPIQVVVAGGSEDVCVRVTDRGGGIPQAETSKVWNYLYTTHTRPDDLADTGHAAGLRGAPLAGLGYGLPISRLFARYFGGDLDLVSVDGHGTDAYVYLSRGAREGHVLL